MDSSLDNKINILKAFAIMLVVSGHIGILIIPFFPTYSFHLALFFFISGYLFKEKHLTDILSYIKGKAKRLLVPYLGYTFLYLIITLAVYKSSGIYYGRPISILNFISKPFEDGSQLLFIGPLWFVVQLFISLTIFILTYKYLKKIWDNKYFHLIFFLILAICAIQLSAYKDNSMILIMERTVFSLFFIYLGYFYKNFVEGKYNIFSAKWLGVIITLQSVLWLYNITNQPRPGVTAGLEYVLVYGDFYNWIVPILTSITGIWASLFIINAFYPYLRSNKFVEQIGENTYHIMANHIFIIYLISNFFLWIKGIAIRPSNNIFWIYSPNRTSYVYFVVVTIISTYIGVGISGINKKIKAM